jgi:hypothetical protein
VLHNAWKVTKAKIYDLNAFVLCQTEYFRWSTLFHDPPQKSRKDTGLAHLDDGNPFLAQDK